MAISFHSEEIKFNLLQKTRHIEWILACIGTHQKETGTLTFIFTSNAHLLRINKEFLNHNYFTDVITFDYTEKDIISGDIFISIEQVRENASFFNVLEADELRRVMIHGVLHLIGFNDTLDEEREAMRELENEALHLWLRKE